MEIVEYLDEQTRKPSGQYAKRFPDGFTETIVPTEMIEDGKKVIKDVIQKQPKFRDELIPKKTFCVCDVAGNIKSITEVKFSQAIEVEGKDHCMELEAGEECTRILNAEIPVIPDVAKADPLKWMLDNHKMGPKDAQGKRRMVRKP